MTRRRSLIALAALLGPVLAACGGGGGGGGGPTAPPPPQPGIVFSPQSAPGQNSVSLAAAAESTIATLILEVRATGVTDLYGVAYDLTYPAAALQFVRAAPGPLLDDGSVQAVVSSPGRLIVGGTLLGQVPGSSGSGVLMTLEFTAVASGEGSLAFAAQRGVSSTGATITGLDWIAGSVRVTR